MGCDPGLITDNIDGLDPMQQPPAWRPELYFFNQPKKLHALSIVAPGRLFFFFPTSQIQNILPEILTNKKPCQLLNSEPQNRRISNIEFRRMETLRSVFLIK